MSSKVAEPSAAGDFGPHVLDLDLAASAAQAEAGLRTITGRELRRRGVVVAVSGGIDSALCAALAARALGPERVFGLLLPERDSSPGSTARGRELCEKFGIPHELVDLTGALEALGCYTWRDRAIRRFVPEFRPGDRFKIAVAGDLLGSDRLNYFSLVVELSSRGGETVTRRMPADVYLEIVAATNMKQRTRKLMEYSHADRLNYAVVGTPNRLEYDQGFFVRGGDGLADVKPIAHLYKSQVYALARHVGVPESILGQTPSTDTYSLPQSQEEFYFALPYRLMDLMLYAYIHGVAPARAGAAAGLTPEQVERVYRDIEAKRRTSRQLHDPARLIHPYDWNRAPTAIA
jgi:NAD+ synthase